MAIPIYRPSPITFQPNLNAEQLKRRTEHARYVAQDVLDHVGKHCESIGLIAVIGLQFIGIRDRHRVFSQNRKCVFCDMEIEVCAIERTDGHSAGKWFAHFYGIRDEKLILFTVDHIVPRAHGGSDGLKNLQSMCTYCNSKKGNICTDPFAAAKIRRHGYYQ